MALSGRPQACGGGVRLHADQGTRRTLRFLQGYRGFLQAGAYVAYDSFFTNPEREMVEVACWAHTGRHFHQALDTDRARMGAVPGYIAQLYAVEKRSRRSGVEGEELLLLREQASQPVLTQLHEYLLKIRGQVLPKSEAGQAVWYALKNWIALTRYCQDGDLSIDNNHTERSLRAIAVGRNNWTFLGSDPRRPDHDRAAKLRRILRVGERRPVCLVSGRALPNRSALDPTTGRIIAAPLGSRPTLT
jgi:hypothetical protein